MILSFMGQPLFSVSLLIITNLFFSSFIFLILFKNNLYLFSPFLFKSQVTIFSENSSPSTPALYKFHSFQIIVRFRKDICLYDEILIFFFFHTINNQIIYIYIYIYVYINYYLGSMDTTKLPTYMYLTQTQMCQECT